MRRDGNEWVAITIYRRRHLPAVETAASFTLINKLFAIGVRSPAIVTPSNLFAERTDDVRSPKARLTLKAVKMSMRHISDTKKTPALIIILAADESFGRTGRKESWWCTTLVSVGHRSSELLQAATAINKKLTGLGFDCWIGLVVHGSRSKDLAVPGQVTVFSLRTFSDIPFSRSTRSEIDPIRSSGRKDAKAKFKK